MKACPRCQHPTETRLKNDVLIEYCPRCHGLSFNRSDLGKLLTPLGPSEKVSAQVDEEPSLSRWVIRGFRSFFNVRPKDTPPATASRTKEAVE